MVDPLSYRDGSDAGRLRRRRGADVDTTGRWRRLAAQFLHANGDVYGDQHLCCDRDVERHRAAQPDRHGHGVADRNEGPAAQPISAADCYLESYRDACAADRHGSAAHQCTADQYILANHGAAQRDATATHEDAAPGDADANATAGVDLRRIISYSLYPATATRPELQGHPVQEVQSAAAGPPSL